MAEPQVKRLKRCRDEVDDGAEGRATHQAAAHQAQGGAAHHPQGQTAPFAIRKSTVSSRDTKATLLQHIAHLEREKAAARESLELENMLLKAALNQPEKLPVVEEYLARFMADRNATSYHELWEDMEKLRAQNSCLLRECERLRNENWRLSIIASHAQHPVFATPLPHPAMPPHAGPSYAHQPMMPHQSMQSL
ncbi:hypothetical protein HDZ31DRAFT_61419 [Schizophyllum fasciatum]